MTSYQTYVRFCPNCGYRGVRRTRLPLHRPRVSGLRAARADHAPPPDLRPAVGPRIRSSAAASLGFGSRLGPGPAAQSPIGLIQLPEWQRRKTAAALSAVSPNGAALSTRPRPNDRASSSPRSPASRSTLSTRLSLSTSTKSAISASRASTHSRAASTRRCPAGSSGRCDKSPASAPPRRRTSASATCSTTARRGSRPPSTCPRSWATTGTIRARSARSVARGSRSTRSRTWRRCSRASRSARSRRP